MLNIRKNVFETNSSSTHSICISKAPAKWGSEIFFKTDDYGWENDTVIDTASYLYTAILGLNNWKEYLDKLESILEDHNVEFQFDLPNGCYRGASIDHGEELYSFVNDILNDEDKLCRFLFGDSVIYTGNDNDGENLKMCDSADEYYYDDNWNKHPNPNHNEEKYEYYYKGN